MTEFPNFMRLLWRDECGASAAEYAMILAIVGAGVAGAALVLGNAISGEMHQYSTCIWSVGLT